MPFQVEGLARGLAEKAQCKLKDVSMLSSVSLYLTNLRVHVPGRPQAPSEPPDGPTAASSARSTAQERAQAVPSARGAGGLVGGRQGQRARAPDACPC